MNNTAEKYLESYSGKYFIKRFPKQYKKFWKTVPRGEAFRFAGLIKTNEYDYLSHIPEEDIYLFMCSLSCVILVDQVMYTHFREGHEKYKKEKHAPRMTVGWMDASPWLVFHDNVIQSRALSRKELVSVFNDFSRFFIEYAPSYIRHVNEFQLCSAMLKDKDVTGGLYGSIYKKNLEEWEAEQDMEWAGQILKGKNSI